MRRTFITGLLLASLLLWAAIAWGQGTYKIESTGVPSAADLPKALLDALQPQGARLVSDSGAEVCDVWLLKSVALVQSAEGSSDALYPGFSVGSLLGVLRFPSAGSDFRGQTIKPGYYSLRYALIPQDGNHMGVNPYRDFVLLSPVAADTQVDKTLKLEDLLRLSRQVSGTPHPAVMSLVPASQGATFPSAVQDDKGHWVLQLKVQGKSAAGEQDFPIGLILIGKAEAG